MKNLMRTIALCLLFSGALMAQNSRSIKITVPNISTNEGVIQVSLFNSKASFLTKACKEITANAQVGKMEFTINDIPEGEYTLSVVHDQNNNGQLDTNFIGMPLEAYGISKSGKSNFGPPSYEGALFELKDADIQLVITL